VAGHITLGIVMIIADFRGIIITTIITLGINNITLITIGIIITTIITLGINNITIITIGIIVANRMLNFMACTYTMANFVLRTICCATFLSEDIAFLISLLK
jgi:hypothetical protein